jgi:uncharacterized protein YdgA (DUF945 family)
MLKKVFKLNFKIVVIALLSLVLLQLITAYVFGFITKTQVDIQFKQMTDSPLIQVKQHKYHRGLFSSDATTEISLNSQVLSKVLNVLPKSDSESIAAIDDKTYSIKYTTHIEHGIFAGILNGYFVPTLAYAKTTIIYPDKVKTVLSRFFNNQPPVSIDNLIYINKSGRFLIHSPKFDYSEAVSGVKVTWGGMDMLLKYNDAFNKFNTQLSVPLFELIAPTKGSALIKSLVYHSDSSNSINNIKVGDTQLTLDEARVEWTDKIAIGFKVGDLLHLFTGISSIEFLNGIDAIDPNSFKFTKISYMSDSHDKNNFFNASADVKFESLVTNGKLYGPMDLSLGISHLDSKAFSQLIDKIADISATPEPTDPKGQAMAKAQFIKVLKQNFGPILVQQPILQLKRFNLSTPDGLIDISGNATTNNFTLADMSDQKKFMQHLVLDVNISVPKPILSYLFVLQMQYLLSAGNAQMDKQSSEALTKVVNILLDNQISIWSKKGYITQSDSLLVTHIAVKDGKVLLNDKEAGE